MEIDSYTVPSRSSVRKAGKTLVSPTDTDEKATALRVLCCTY